MPPSSSGQSLEVDAAAPAKPPSTEAISLLGDAEASDPGVLKRSRDGSFALVRSHAVRSGPRCVICLSKHTMRRHGMGPRVPS